MHRRLKEIFLSGGLSNPGRGGQGEGGVKVRGGFSPRVKKPKNPKDSQGNTMRCVSYHSIHHLLKKFQDSYKNLKKSCNTILAGTNEDIMNEESYITNHIDKSMMKAEQEG